MSYLSARVILGRFFCRLFRPSSFSKSNRDTDRFEWDDAVSYTPEQQLEIERLLLQYYDIDPEYFKTKYNVDITGVKSSLGFGGAVAELKKKSSPLKTLDELYGI